jgi:hypothetical protein
MAGDTLLDQLLRVNAALDGLSTRERLDVVTLVWLLAARAARYEALIAPGGFPDERSRQVEQLHKIADLIAADEPDLDMERLNLEGDIEGILERVRAEFDDGQKGADHE